MERQTIKFVSPVSIVISPKSSDEKFVTLNLNELRDHIAMWAKEGCDKIDISAEIYSVSESETELESVEIYAYQEKLESEEDFNKRVEAKKIEDESRAERQRQHDLAIYGRIRDKYGLL
jgi:hypothetical protein